MVHAGSQWEAFLKPTSLGCRWVWSLPGGQVSRELLPSAPCLGNEQPASPRPLHLEELAVKVKVTEELLGTSALPPSEHGDDNTATALPAQATYPGSPAAGWRLLIAPAHSSLGLQWMNLATVATEQKPRESPGRSCNPDRARPPPLSEQVLLDSCPSRPFCPDWAPWASGVLGDH